ncbi:MAG: hypothetical protein ACYC5O_03665 [Anaerolineae bacterium]
MGTRWMVPDALRRRGRLMAVWSLGLTSATVYWLAFTARYPLLANYRQLADIGILARYRVEAAATYGIACVLLFAFYIAACRLVRGLSLARSRWAIVAPALIAAVACLLLYPITAMDIYYYIITARVWMVHGANPLATAPDGFGGDPYLAYAGDYAHHPSPYGPVWALLSAPAGLTSASSLLVSLLVLKTLALLAYCACGALVVWIVSRLRPGEEASALLLVAWNPLVLLEAIGNGHNDMVMALFVLSAVALALSRWRLASPAALALAALVKLPAVILLPPLLIYLAQSERSTAGKVRRLVASAVLAALVVAAGYALFWDGSAAFAGILRQGGFVGTSPSYLLLQAAAVVVPGVPAAIRGLFLPLCFGAYYLWQLLTVAHHPDRWLDVTASIVFCLVLVLGLFKAWYLLWVLPLAVITLKPRPIVSVVIFTLTALLSTLIYGFLGVWNGWDYHENLLLGVPLVFLPPLIYLLLTREQPTGMASALA